jgi:hypothetical protein
MVLAGVIGLISFSLESSALQGGGAHRALFAVVLACVIALAFRISYHAAVA